MFENIRQALSDLASGAIPPAQRAAVLAHMRATLVQAKVGVADIAAARDKTKVLLASEQDDLATVRRRKGQAEQIGDKATVEIASRFEAKHSGRVEVLVRKLAVQDDELRLAEAEMEGMMAALKDAGAGVGAIPEPRGASAQADDVLNEEQNLKRDLDGLARQKARQSREADAEDRLAELKRKMRE